jgi:hypothetical protein
MLSSDSLLASTSLSGGELDMVGMVGMVGGDRWPPSRSSWKMGILELVGAPRCDYICITERLAFCCECCCRERAGEFQEMSSPLVTAGMGLCGD